MKHSIKTITPKMANDLLEKNTRNRTLSMRSVDNIVREIKEGRWELNYQPIIVGDNDVLIDGQHRLRACVKSGMPIKTAYVTDADPSIFDIVDTGGKGNRSAQDIFAINGEKNTSLIVAGLKIIDRYLQGVPMNRSKYYSNRMMETLLEEHPDIRRSANFLAKHKPIRMGSNGTLAGLHYLFSMVDEEKANEFIIAYVSGVGLEEGSPILVLRNKMIKAALTKTAYHPTVFQAFVIKTWNAFIKEKPMKVLQWSTKQGSEEAFPTIAST